MARGLTLWVLVALLLGVAAGLACHSLISDPAILADWISGFSLVTTIFLRAIRMIIAPLVLSTLISGVARMGEGSAVGRIAVRSLLWFVLASAAAIVGALAVVEVIAPGSGMHLHAAAGAGAAVKAQPFTLAGFVAELVPVSITDAMANNAMLQIVVFALVAGVALGKLGGKGDNLVAFAESVAALMLRITVTVMLLAPFAVFAAVASALAAQGVEIIARYAIYVGGFYVALALVWALMLGASALLMGPSRILPFLAAVRPPVLIALTTASSEAAYPSLLQRLEEYGVPNRVVAFVLPLGYSFNLVGSMCYCTFAVVFLAQAYDVPLSGGRLAELLLMLFVMSKGIASVPRAALITIAAVIPYFQIPDVGIALILGVDHFLDMGRTATNALANGLAAAGVAQWEAES
jgi:Na+/H+-dicarboxylate symporter